MVLTRTIVRDCCVIKTTEDLKRGQRSRKIRCIIKTSGWMNKELFKNAPPYMIIRPSLKGGLYMSAGQISK